jgi:S1-C subfamily serine protease
MENLTKQQIILLTLLVSFVTSIATGIVTVSLMNQAPVGVVQTINRVIEKTIQTVTTPSNDTQTIVKETTVVSVDDQVVNAINKNSNSIIRIYKTGIDPASGLNSTVFVGLGVVISDNGVIVTDNSLISDGEKYFTNTASNVSHDLSILRAVSGEQVALLQIKNDDKNPITFSKASISSSDLKLGQEVVYIGGETKNTVATGIVSSLSTTDIKPANNSTSTPIKTKISAIETSMAQDFIPGGILLNLSGELVGIKSAYMNSSKTNLFAPSSDISDVISALATSSKKTQ